MEHTPTYRYFTVTGKSANRGSAHIPIIHLAGRWLDKAGFSVGTIVQLEVNKECLTIRKSPKQWLLEGK